MDEKQQILYLYRVENKSMREIAKKVGVARKTVERWVKDFERAVSENPETGLDEYLAMKPKYRKRKYQSRVLTESVMREIDRCLKENERRRMSGKRKQCMKGKDIHRLLEEKGYRLSYQTVCNYIASKRKERVAQDKDVYIRMRREEGQECEFDWGEVKLKIRGVESRLMMAIFVFPFSGGRYAYLFHRQDALAFAEAHRNFFREVGGVPEEMVYDNMRVAVTFRENRKEATELLQRMSTHYRFRYRFCNLRSGWEKGNVERSVEYVRRRAFSLQDEFGSLNEAQRWLSGITGKINEERCGTSEGNRLQVEIASLKPYGNDFGCFELVPRTVDKQSTISLYRNRYSVPERYVDKSVIAKVYSEKILVYDRPSTQPIAVHERCYGTEQWIIDIAHYVDTLLRKTGALERSEAFHQMPGKMQRLYRTCFKENAKEFLLLVKYVRDNPVSYDEIFAAVETLWKSGVRRFTTDQVKVALQTRASGDEAFREEQKTDQFIEIELGSADILSQLENLMEKGANI